MGYYEDRYGAKQKYAHRMRAQDTPQGWTRLRRKTHKVKGTLLRSLETFVTGNYALGPFFVIFENEQDAVLYRLKYPR